MNVSDLKTKLQEVLDGEPLRAIVGGAAVVVWLVTHIAIAVGYQGFGPNPVNFTESLVLVTVAAGALTEFLRRFVYSPATVAALTGDGPVVGTEVVNPAP